MNICRRPDKPNTVVWSDLFEMAASTGAGWMCMCKEHHALYCKTCRFKVTPAFYKFNLVKADTTTFCSVCTMGYGQGHVIKDHEDAGIQAPLA